MSIGYRIFATANEKGVRIKKLAEMAGVPYSTLHSICKRDSSRIDPDTLSKVANALDVDIEQLYRGSDQEAAATENEAVRDATADIQAKIEQLNPAGLKKLYDYADLLADSGRYKKYPPVILLD